MTRDPHITLNLKCLLRLVPPVMQRKDREAGLRASPILARGIACHWRERGEVQCLKPIAIGLISNFRFTELPQWTGSGSGTLEIPIEAVPDICDGIQQLTALSLTPPKLANLRQTD